MGTIPSSPSRPTVRLRPPPPFDYETNASTYSIRVQAKDEHNATVEGNFTVTLTNLNEPVTGTVSVSGTPVVGQTLTASNTWPIDGLGAVTTMVPRRGADRALGGNFEGRSERGGWVGRGTRVYATGDNKHVYVTRFH